MKVSNAAQGFAINQLSEVQRDISSNVKKLSSGKEVSGFSENSAQASHVVKLKNTENSMHQVGQHLSQGVSYFQVAESAMNDVSSLLTRMKELATQGASDTVGDSERTLIDAEVSQLQAEIDRIAENTKYNGENLVNGSGKNLSILAGENSFVEFDFAKLDVSARKLGVSGLSVSSQSEASSGIDSIDEALSSLSEQRAGVSAVSSRLNFAMENNSTQAVNMAEARTKMESLDYAKEVTEYTANNIKSQAATSVLSQANFNKANVLKLLN